MRRMGRAQWTQFSEGLLLPALALSLPAVFDLPLGVAAGCFLMLTALPLLHTLFWTRKLRVLDPLVLVSLVYLIGYPVPILFRSVLSDPLLASSSDAAVSAALMWSYRGFALLMLVYLAFRSSFADTASRDFDVNGHVLGAKTGYVSLARWIGMVSILSMMGVFIMDRGIAPAFFTPDYVDRSSAMRQFFHHLTQLGYGFFFIYCTLRVQSVRKKSLDQIFAVLLVLHLMLIVGAGAKYFFLALMLSILLSLNSAKEVVTTRKVLIFFFLLISIYMIFSVVTHYRVIAFNTYIDDSTSFADRVLVQAGMFKDAVGLSVAEYRVGKSEHSLGVTKSILERLTAVNSLARLIQFTGGVPPYENADKVLLMPFYAFMPSSLFPEKPHFFDAGDFARMFGWRSGGLSVTLSGSLYWCWGYAGICIGMALVGMLFSLLVSMSQRLAVNSAVYQALLVVLLLHLMDPGRTFQSLMLDLIRPWLFLLGINFVRRLVMIRPSSAR